jgi:hypothetical protein
MSGGTLMSPVGAALPRWRYPVAQERIVDIFAVLTVAALPWSTSQVAVFIVAWLVTVALTLNIKLFVRSLKRPACALPVGGSHRWTWDWID